MWPCTQNKCALIAMVKVVVELAGHERVCRQSGFHLSGKNIEQIYGYQWDSFAQIVSPDLQFLNKDWYATWERKYLPQINPDSQIRYISLFDDKDNMHGTFPYVEFSKLGLKILSVAGLYYPFRSILFSS